ncbi:MAG: phosphoglycerate kinase [Candidatus Jidaibacter sp.]|jgi:phosphoglycerate kinase|nr:phosphoglycerate kinase [Candidatus Jidaibacter sp.]
MKDLKNAYLLGQRVLLRVDLNVPLHAGKVLDFSRITNIQPTIDFLKKNGAQIILASHFGRPKGFVDPIYSLEFLVPILKEIYGEEILFSKTPSLPAAKKGEIVLLENLRFNAGEEANDIEFAKKLAGLADIYVNDAFSCSHREHASICAITQLLPSYPGLAFESELNSLKASIDPSASPKIAIIAGLKVSSKFKVLASLVDTSDHLIIGGAMANTFLQALGFNMQASFVETDFLEQALQFYNLHKDKIILPIDLVCDVHGTAQEHDVEFLPEGARALDVGPKSIAMFIAKIKHSRILLWNGPLGYYEDEKFAQASLHLAEAIGNMPNLRSIAGGGDTIASIGKFGDKFSYVSTSGGAFLEWLEDFDLPGIRCLRGALPK